MSLNGWDFAQPLLRESRSSGHSSQEPPFPLGQPQDSWNFEQFSRLWGGRKMVKGHERSGISINQWYPKDIEGTFTIFHLFQLFPCWTHAWTQRKNRSTKTHLDVDRKLPAMGWENVFPAFSLGKWRGRRCSIRRCWFIEPKLKILFQHLAIVRLPAFKMCVPFDPSKTRRRLKCFISPRPMWALTIPFCSVNLGPCDNLKSKKTLGTYSLYSTYYI